MNVERDHGQSLCRSSVQEVHLFGSYGPPATPLSWPAYDRLIPTTWSARSSRPRLWSISGRGWSRQRFDAGSPLTPLTRSEVTATGPGVSTSPRPMAKLAIKVSGMAVAKQPLIIDADQTIELYGSSIDVDALVPSNVQNVGSPRSAQLEVDAGELAVDDLVGVVALEIEESIGARSAVLTTYVVADQSAVASVAVPRGAFELLVSPADQAELGVWSWTIGDPNVLTTTATVGSFVPTNQYLRVPSASHLVLAASGQNVRVYALTWKIHA